MNDTAQTEPRTLGTVLESASIRLDDALILRHTYSGGGLMDSSHLTPDRVIAYTREQGHRSKVPADPPPLWFVFMAEDGLSSRLLTVYENHGPVPREETGTHRYFDLRPSNLLTGLHQRLVVQWSRDPVNWAKRGGKAADFPVIEFSEPGSIPYPGFR